MKVLRLAIAGGLVGSGLLVMGWSQQGVSRLPSLSDPQVGPLQPGADRRNAPTAADSDTVTSRMDALQAKTRNSERQKKLSADSERLLAVAEELKEEMDKTDSNANVSEAAKKAEEIEKLAKSVKDHMRS